MQYYFACRYICCCNETISPCGINKASVYPSSTTRFSREDARVTWREGGGRTCLCFGSKGKLREERKEETWRGCWNYSLGFPPAPQCPALPVWILQQWCLKFQPSSGSQVLEMNLRVQLASWRSSGTRRSLALSRASCLQLMSGMFDSRGSA